jgi:hypothetical protein
MELAHPNELCYMHIELHAYRTAFPYFKYKPLSFVYVEIGTNRRVPTTRSMALPNQLPH